VFILKGIVADEGARPIRSKDVVSLWDADPVGRERWLVNDKVFSPQGVLDVWQAKELWEGDFGSVAMIELTDEFSEV
jgi:hypothetical protein